MLNIRRQKYCALIDTGSEKSLISRRVYRTIPNRPKLSRSDINLQSVTGNQVRIDGSINLEFVVAGLNLCHTFYVVPELGRNAF